MNALNQSLADCASTWNAHQIRTADRQSPKNMFPPCWLMNLIPNPPCERFFLLLTLSYLVESYRVAEFLNYPDGYIYSNQDIVKRLWVSKNNVVVNLGYGQMTDEELELVVNAFGLFDSMDAHDNIFAYRDIKMFVIDLRRMDIE